ncbi:LuxR family transcriptional regulator [Sulfitobacter sp. JBTF-M27]|uniref:LuxR family transcriptional regulator n=2 Tax=Sulfitobacter sediminilitoris TaxID=2698830 RepID=A0A6P0CBA6_9RHOB|nr:LuxR family transcriptional regulator [Sulfitobacter sediminilitoris]
MMQGIPLQEFIAHCKDIERLRDLWCAALDFFHSRGIAMVSYHSDDAEAPGAAPLAIVEDGFPRDWVSKYIDGNLSRIDPIPELAAKLNRPFRWSEAGELAALTEDQKHYMQLLAAAKLGDGLAMQVYGPNMRNAYIELGFGANTAELSAQDISELRCAAQMAHLRYCEITADRQHRAELSPIELEVLRWIAEGKSNSVIADILGISRHTVDTMTRRMFEKLEVHDRTSAAVRGLGSGLLHYRHQQAG